MARVGIIGSGLGGLAAACVAAARGHEVQLFERNEWLGGKAAVLEAEGFRFDMGPTILTVPTVLQRIFEEAGRELSSYLDLRSLDPQWRCFFDDGESLDLVADVDQMSENIEAFTPGSDSAEGYRDFLDLSASMHDVSNRFFFWKSVEDIRDTMNMRANFDLDTLKAVLGLRMGKSVAGVIRERVPDARVAQMLDHFIQYVGSSPFQAPAVLTGIAHMQTELGVWYPIGGTRAVPEALVQLGRELGVEYHCGIQVEEITVSDGEASGIRCDGQIRMFDAVISNMDSVRTYRELIKGVDKAPRQVRKPEPACSGVVLYLGLRARYEHLAHHNFVFSKDPHEEFEAIYQRGEPAPDPTCYLAAPSVTEPDVAPAGGEALYILVHTPYLRDGHDWEQMFPGYRQVIFDKLARSADMPDLADRIVFESALSPEDIHRRYQVLDGAIYGLASHGKFRGAFKPGNRSREVRNLYLAGGAANPGAGMPMVMMSGWIAADAMDQDFAHASV